MEVEVDLAQNSHTFTLAVDRLGVKPITAQFVRSLNGAYIASSIQFDLNGRVLLLEESQ